MNKQEFDEMDELARQALHNMEMPFNPDDWALMEQRLNRGEHRSPRLWLFKGIEVLVIALAVFTIFSVTSGKDDQTAQDRTAAQQTNEAAGTDAEAGTAHTLVLNAASNQSGNEKTTSYTHLQSALQTHSAIALNSDKQLPKAGSIQLRNTETAQRALLSSSALSANHVTAKSLNALPLGLSLMGANLSGGRMQQPTNLSQQGLTTETRTGNTSTSDGASIILSDAVADGGEHNSLLAATPQWTAAPETTTAAAETETGRNYLNTTMLQTIQATEGDGIEEPLFELKRVKNNENYQRRLRLGVHLSADANTDCGYGNSHLGYSGGWSIETEFSYHFSLQSGINVSQKNYRNQRSFVATSPVGENKTYAVEEESVNRITAIQIPLALQGSLFRNKHWRLGLHAGIIANFIVAKSHVGVQKINQDGLILHNQLNPNDFERGWWQGASLTNNFYWSVGGGALIERQLTDRWSLLIQPQYYQSLALRNERKAGYKVGSFSMTVGIRGTF